MSTIRNQFNDSKFDNTTFIDYGGTLISKSLGGFPITPDLFIGREHTIEEIHRRLSDKNNLLLLVNGKGGIGKTTIASQYYFEYAQHYAHLIWIVPEKGIKEAIISLALDLGIQFSHERTPAQQVQKVLGAIAALQRPVLLIIDNANNLDDLDDNYQLLRQFHHIHILITSRISAYQHIDTYKVNHLDKKSANELFKKHFTAFKPEEQELLDKVLVAIGYNTLVIELLAKNLKAFNNDFKEHYPLERLLEDIQQKGVLAISKSAQVRTDYRLEPAKPEEMIKSMYDVSKLSEEEKSILSIFATLPATAVPFSYLELFLPNIEALDRVILQLSQKGWIEYDKVFKSFKTNPIISEVAKEHNKDRLEKDTRSLLIVLIEKLDYEPGTGHINGEFNEINRVVALSEVFVNNFTRLSYNLGILFNRIGNFYKTYGNLSNALKYFEDCLKLTKVLYESTPNDVRFKDGLAIAYAKLGETQYSLGHLDKALEFFKNVTVLFEELFERYPDNMGFKSGLGISYEKLGSTYLALGHLDKALKFFEDETVLFKELNKSNPNNVAFKNGLAISYERLGSKYFSYGYLDKALKFFEERSRLGKELFERYPNNMEFKSGLAISYEKLGDTHSSLKNLDKALTFFEKRSRLGKELFERYPNNVGFKNGLAISYSKLGETHSALGHLDKALTFFEERSRLSKELFERYPSNVGFKNGLAFSYIKLGVLFVDKLNKQKKGIGFLNAAKGLLQDLVDKYPSYKRFQKNLNLVNEKIDSLEGA